LRKHYGFSVETGNYLWETESEHFLNAYGWGNAEHTWYFAYGKLYSVGVGGILYAYDLKTGKAAWTYEFNDPYSESVTGQNWWGWIALIADGKVYLAHCEHSAEQPLPRGAPFVCLDAETGNVIWRVNGMFRGTRWGGNAVIGDSIIATMDTYDQRIYAIGKGPSKTTVSASPKVSVHGGKVLVEGSVTDISPGTDDIVLKKRFPHGVPAVADECMSEWMLYVYKQFECPANVKGVEVIIEVLDPNNNYYEVARTTSDGSGFYSATFDPPVPGKYTIIARFAGSKAYWPSHAETAIVVEEAPPATTETTQPTTSVADMYFVPAVIGIIVAIVVVGLVIILMLRKR
ncbi:MAG: PQQ-binding-like beta-propeller repeat protein, partial [Candidatus Bathyarchaeales archaeon]